MKHNLTWMTGRPIAHRGLHNTANNILENTLPACRAAMQMGYNIEVDLHPSSTGEPIVFHDATLERLAGDPRNVRDLSPAELGNISLENSDENIATFEQLLQLVDGKTGIVLEMKGVAGEDEGFVAAIADCLKNYHGPVAIMSFYHWLLKDARQFAPSLPLGLTAMGDDERYQQHETIAAQCDFDFLSYKWKDLPCKFATQFRQTGKPLICWTVKSPAQQPKALRHCDQITFEGFKPASN